MKVYALSSLLFLLICSCLLAQEAALKLNEAGYFDMPGLSVMVFQDIYPEGHQGGIGIIQNGTRVASNGDLRLEPAPGQWQPIPRQVKRAAEGSINQVTVTLEYPDPARDRKGFNPIIYPDLKLSYQVRVKAEGKHFLVFVDLDQPLPEEWIGRVGFNLELYPDDLAGKTWYLGAQSGMFPPQPNGPVAKDRSGELQPAVLGAGERLTIAPESDAQRMTIESQTNEILLLDGRNNHNNGWFVVRSLVQAGTTREAIQWKVSPHAIPGWRYKPVVHLSQVGYHPKQRKIAVVEEDLADDQTAVLEVKRVSEDGALESVLSGKPATWGKFLRYQYSQFDFSSVKRPGVYIIEYRSFRSHPFRIDADIFKKDIWQPTLSHFLPAQMCHMRVNEKYRVWHGLCHMDDALMAPVDHNHFDGYNQGPSTLTKYQPWEPVPGLNAGGWHDAGDDDLRIESQADEVFILAAAYEAFNVAYDQTSIDQQNHVVEIHEPDGRNDLLQQVEHGILTILGGYKGLGRLYRGMIVPTLRQYVLLGDTANVSDNLIFDPKLKESEKTATHSGKRDDRLVFTEQHAGHEYKAITALAIAGRVLRTYNRALADECVQAAEALWNQERDSRRAFRDKITAGVELLLTTKKPEYKDFLLQSRAQIVSGIGGTGWAVGRALPLIDDPGFKDEIKAAVTTQFANVQKQQQENPFGVPYRPRIWGAGWDIQRFGVEQYFLHASFPDVVSTEYMLNALNFVLGCHPGENTASFASGVGSRSMTIAYGFNRADRSYIPGGVVSGTALIRPDFPELKDFPYLWQQTEYVLGGGATNFMFLVLAADQVLNQ